MSRNRRRFSPHGRKFNERGIQRSHNVFDKGLVTDTIDVPNGALGELDNARAFGSEIRGSHGSLLHNRADYQLSPNSNESYAVALAQGGSIYEAKGSAPTTGDIFLTLSQSDFSDVALRTAKRWYYNSRKYDQYRGTFIDFKYTNTVAGSGEAGNSSISYFDKNGVDVSSIISSNLLSNTRFAIADSVDEKEYSENYITSIVDDVINQRFDCVRDFFQSRTGITFPNTPGQDVRVYLLGEGRYYNDEFPSPQNYEFYEIDATLDYPIYRGYLQIPFYNGFHSRIVNNYYLRFPIQKTGDTLVINRELSVIPDTFTSDLIGMYFNYGIVLNENNVPIVRRDLIVDIVDPNTLKVSSDSIVSDGAYENCMIQPQIHSSIYMPSVNKLYFHVGYDFYEVSVPIMEWKLLHGIYERRPFNSPSIMSEVKGDVLVTNDNGHFRIKVNKGDEPTHYWKINSVRPDKSSNAIKYFFGFETSISSTGENPYAPRGFSGEAASGDSDKTGGSIL